MLSIVFGSARAAIQRTSEAVASGQEDASVLSAKQPKGKKRKNKLTTSSNVAVDPQLPDEVMARLINLRKQGAQGSERGKAARQPSKNPNASDVPQRRLVSRPVL